LKFSCFVFFYTINEVVIMTIAIVEVVIVTIIVMIVDLQRRHGGDQSGAEGGREAGQFL
jgi:preprotein translocase subunit SecG